MSAERGHDKAMHFHSFGLDCTRLAVSKDATAASLADDFHCLFEAAHSAIENMAEAASCLDGPPEIANSWWVMLYTMRHASAVFGHLHDAIQRAEAANPTTTEEQQLARETTVRPVARASLATKGGAA